MKLTMKKIISPSHPGQALRTHPGFTFIELLFAIVVMGTMFALALVVFVGMLRFYVFAGSVRTNQENARNVLDTISRDVRFGQLIEPSGSSSSNTLCVYKKADRTVVKYVLTTSNTLGVTTTGFSRSTLAEQSSLPTNCDGDGFVESSVFNTKATAAAFAVTKLGGASNTVYPTVSSVIIRLQVITGNPDSTGLACASNNIYCNSLTLNTAVNIRGSQ